MPSITITEMAAGEALGGVELLEISQPSTTVTKTATTISAQASDNSFNDSGSGFVTAGFAVGDRVRVTGFTGNVANNIFTAKITALTAGKMTIGGTDGDVIVDDAAGESVTITKWVTRRTTVQEIVDLASSASTTEVAEVSGTSHNLLAVENSTYIRFTNSSAKTCTVQPESTEPMPANGEWHLRNVGTGDLTIVEGSGVTIIPPNGGTLVVPEGGTVTVKRVAEDEYDLLGQTVAA